MTEPNLNILGVMTGTSCDGLDAACIEINPNGWTPLWSASLPYPPALRKSVLAFQVPGSLHSTRSWLELHRDLGDWYGTNLRKLIRKQKQAPDVIANHGQTVGHFPEKAFKGTTLQLGDGARIATQTGLTVVSRFREGDMAAGGQGAPLVPLFHQMLALPLNENKPGIAFHNIGGISNLTYLGPQGKILAFDTGPGNMWIDAAVQKITNGKMKFDREGKLASQGKVDLPALRAILEHPFFSKTAPKSTGRDDFPSSSFFSQTRVKGLSLVATATAVTVESIAQAYEVSIIRKRLPLKTILLCGGGAKNKFLLEQLKTRLPQVTIATLSERGFDSQFIEAQAFAVFGFLSLMGIPLGGEWTGAQTYAPPGQIIPGKNWTPLVLKLHHFLKD